PLLQPLRALAGALLLLDLRAGAEPADHLAVVAVLGERLCQEPAVLPVVPAEAALGRERLAAFQGGAPAVRARVAVVGVEHPAPALAARLVEAEAGVLVPAAVEVLVGAVPA